MEYRVWPHGLSDYEKEREERVRQNKAYMESLGIFDAAAEMQRIQAVSNPQSSRKKRKITPPQRRKSPTRSSSRINGQQGPAVRDQWVSISSTANTPLPFGEVMKSLPSFWKMLDTTKEELVANTRDPGRRNGPTMDLDRLWIQTTNLGGLAACFGPGSKTISAGHDPRNKRTLAFTITRDSRFSWVVCAETVLASRSALWDPDLDDEDVQNQTAALKQELRQNLCKAMNGALRQTGNNGTLVANTWPKTNALVRNDTSIVLSAKVLKHFGRALKRMSEEGKHFTSIITQHGQKTNLAETSDWLPRLAENAEAVELDIAVRISREARTEDERCLPLLCWRDDDTQNTFGNKTNIYPLFPFAQKVRPLNYKPRILPLPL